MKKNLKLLSGILMASFISTPIIDSSDTAKARPSRQVVVSSSSNQVSNLSTTTFSQQELDNSEISNQNLGENSPNTNSEQNLDETIPNDDTSQIQNNTGSTLEQDTIVEGTEETQGTSIFEMLNSDKNITIDEITSLSMPLSHSSDFKDEFNATFPDLTPLRQLSSTSNNLDLYLDVNSNETKSVTQYLNNSKNYPSVYADQNKCNMLLSEIDRIILEINDEISTELPSTIFSLMPTVTVFNDTFKILSLEYNSIMETNSENQIVLKILLKDVEDKLVSLLSSINEFRNQLPDLIEELDNLAKLSSSSSNNSSNNTSNNNLITDESQIQDNIDEDELLEEEIIEEDVQEEIAEDTDVEEEVVEDTNDSQQTTEKEEVVEEEVVEEEEIDPNSIILYFGDQGQEVLYDESTKKYYQIDPENPNSEDLVEYSGEVIEMTLAEYLDMDVFLDSEGNELIYDQDTDSYFLYDVKNDEFVLYEGEVTKLKIKDLIESNE